jgi:HlyD family secretion protein
LCNELVLRRAAGPRHCLRDTGVLGRKTPAYQGYVEGEYVHVASPVGGRLDRLLVQRGRTIAAKAALFELEAEQEAAGRAGNRGNS